MRLSHLPTLTVGIPAYNEEANIVYLLADILRQKEQGFVLERIIVNSDGSTDGTVREAKKLSDRRILLFDDGSRKGQAVRQNEIIRANRSDILVLLNADITLEGNGFLRELLRPLLDGSADFTSSNLLPITPSTFVEKVLAAGFVFKSILFGSWRQGKNVYTCHGAARAFTRRYFKNFSFFESVGEDAYTYFFGWQHGLRYEYQSQAVARIKLPENPSDHFNQNTRFHQSKEILRNTFGASVQKEYRFSRLVLARSLCLAFFKHPIFFPMYVALYVYSAFSASSHYVSTQTWETAASSKKLRS